MVRFTILVQFTTSDGGNGNNCVPYCTEPLSGRLLMVRKLLFNFNKSKTEIIVFGPSDSRSTPKVNLADLTSSVKPWVKKSGCYF